MMFIDENHTEIINTERISVHDMLFHGIQYNYEQDNIEVNLESPPMMNSNNLKIVFHGVLGFNMVACTFWGESPHVLSFYCKPKGDQIIVTQLSEEAQKYNYNSKKFNPNNNYIEAILELSSGDRLTIACHAISVI